MMKKTIYMILALGTLLLSSCERDELNPVSVIKDSNVEMNDFDMWLESNFLLPYNIEFVYRYRLNESELGYYTVPADYDSAIIYAHLVKYLCVDTYDEIAGVNFTRGYFPKMFFLIGTWEYKNNGSIVLGTAEAGKKIMLAGVNELPLVFQQMSGAELEDYLNTYYIKTIHHEFTHILNQTKVFSDVFKQITPSTYVGDACFDTDDNWLGRGYISAYSQAEPREDFAELLSEYVTHSAEWWDAQLKTATSQLSQVQQDDPSATDGAALLSQKIDIVRNYMLDSWAIDIDKLRTIITRRMGDILAGNVDLNTVNLN